MLHLEASALIHHNPPCHMMLQTRWSMSCCAPNSATGYFLKVPSAALEYPLVPKTLYTLLAWFCAQAPPNWRGAQLNQYSTIHSCGCLYKVITTKSPSYNTIGPELLPDAPPYIRYSSCLSLRGSLMCTFVLGSTYRTVYTNTQALAEVTLWHWPGHWSLPNSLQKCCTGDTRWCILTSRYFCTT